MHKHEAGFLSAVPTARSAAPPLAPTLSPSAPLTILLADDEPVVRYVIAQMLTRLGHQVMLACDGLEALKSYEAHGHDIDLVIFDLTMPNVPGSALFREIKSINPDIRALLTTGNYEDEVIEDMRTDGLTGFLAKPFDIYDLERELTRVLQA
jgi:two-component system cell cycle sensor histidine kinase/response regulator CckA